MGQNDTFATLQSRSNAKFKNLKQLAHDNNAARAQQRVWLEGDHLVKAAVQRGIAVGAVVATQTGIRQLTQMGVGHRAEINLLSEALWRELSQLGSVYEFAAIVNLPLTTNLDTSGPTVVLDRIQDPGNVGSILRSASAFGYRQVLALKGTASLWSPKVVRAGMGAHFGLQLHESLTIEDLAGLRQYRCVTSSHQGSSLSSVRAAAAGRSLAWIFGNEGQGVMKALLESADLSVCIDQPGGEESLNVAAAAAICLHASAMQ